MPCLQPFLDLGAVRAGEFESFQGVGDGVLFLPGANIDAGEILRALRRLQLREMDDIDRPLPSATRLSSVLASGNSE